MSVRNLQLEVLTEQLLRTHECVIIPGLGGFIVRDSPSNFNAGKDQIKPFARHIFFNPHLRDNDGLLIHQIQQNTGMPFSEAGIACRNLTDELRNRIENEGSVRYGELGTFFKGQENPWFAPSSGLNLAIESYGLEPIAIRPVETIVKTVEEIIPAETAAIADRKAIESGDYSYSGLRPWLIAASVALLVHFVYLFTEKTDTNVHEASVIPTIQMPTGNAQSESVTNANTITYESLSTATDSISTTAPAEPEQSATVINEETPAAEETLIPASEPVQSEQTVNEVCIARYRLEKNAGFHVSDIQKKGLHARVELKDGWYQVVIPESEKQ